jgi:hypothetical protein
VKSVAEEKVKSYVEVGAAVVGAAVGVAAGVAATVQRIPKKKLYEDQCSRPDRAQLDKWSKEDRREKN